MKSTDYWDNKAKNFPRYNKTNDEFQESIINFLVHNGILSKQSSVLDVGCGTGIYTIPLSKRVFKILALDVSSKMLEILKNDANANGVGDNIETLSSSWVDFNENDTYDVVFASMSAAFHNEEDYEKILRYSKKYACFLHFSEKNGTNFEKILSKKYNVNYHDFAIMENLKQWLESKNIEFKAKTFIKNKNDMLEIKQAKNKIKQLLSSRIATLPSDEEILEILKPLKIQDKISFIDNSKVELVYWQCL